MKYIYTVENFVVNQKLSNTCTAQIKRGKQGHHGLPPVYALKK